MGTLKESFEYTTVSGYTFGSSILKDKHALFILAWLWFKPFTASTYAVVVRPFSASYSRVAAILIFDLSISLASFLGTPFIAREIIVNIVKFKELDENYRVLSWPPISANLVGIWPEITNQFIYFFTGMFKSAQQDVFISSKSHFWVKSNTDFLDRSSPRLNFEEKLNKFGLFWGYFRPYFGNAIFLKNFLWCIVKYRVYREYRTIAENIAATLSFA